MINWLKLTISILICLGIGLIGSLFTMPAISGWYAGLTKPSFSPPNWIFGPVWTTLYILMGISFYLISQKVKAGQEKKIAFLVFAVQLGLNLLWSIVFFGLQLPVIALLTIIVLWLQIVANIYVFWKLYRPAGYLLIPYLLWVSFASVLNLFVVRLNS